MTTIRPVGPPPPYDPECGAVLAGLPPFPPLTTDDPRRARRQNRVRATADRTRNWHGRPLRRRSS